MVPVTFVAGQLLGRGELKVLAFGNGLLMQYLK